MLRSPGLWKSSGSIYTLHPSSLATTGITAWHHQPIVTGQKNAKDQLLREQVHSNAHSDHSLRFFSPKLCDPEVEQYSGYPNVTDGKDFFSLITMYLTHFFHAFSITKRPSDGTLCRFFEACKNPETTPLICFQSAQPDFDRIMTAISSVLACLAKQWPWLLTLHQAPLWTWPLLNHKEHHLAHHLCSSDYLPPNAHPAHCVWQLGLLAGCVMAALITPEPPHHCEQSCQLGHEWTVLSLHHYGQLFIWNCLLSLCPLHPLQPAVPMGSLQLYISGRDILFRQLNFCGGFVGWSCRVPPTPACCCT